MKKYLFFISALFVICTVRAQQLQQLHAGDREPTFYYWDTNWWDYVYLNYPPHPASLWMQDHMNITNGPMAGTGCKCELARPCHTDTALRIIGVAAPVYIGWYDDCESNILDPEYFKLYTLGPQNEMVLQASARWDTFVPRYEMCVRVGHQYSFENDSGWAVEVFYPVYEAYFDHPVTVEGDFYVSGTSNNNYRHGKWEVNEYAINGQHFCDSNLLTWQARPSILYMTSMYPTFPMYSHLGVPLYNYLMMKYHYIDEYNRPMAMLNPADTNWFYYGFTPRQFFNMFPIFDTSSTVVDVNPDTCHAPTGLNVRRLSDSSFLFTWEGYGGSLWEFNLMADGSNPDSSTSIVCHTPFVTLSLTDSSQWYTAQVRTICDSAIVSEWSESVRLHVDYGTTPGTGGGGTTLVPSVLDVYTSLVPNPAGNRVAVMSSFQVKELEIYDLNGKLMMAAKPHAVSVEVDLEGYPSGTYMVRITTTRGVVYKRLIVR